MRTAAPASSGATYAEYLAIEAASQLRHEYIAGAIVAMAGGTIEHSRLISRIQYLPLRGLEGKPCAVLASDARDPDDDHAIVNPTVIIEVLSESTASYDREQKQSDDRRRPSLSEYVLISQRERSVEIFRRSGPRRWSVEELLSGERLPLSSLGVELTVDEIYRDHMGAIIPESAGLSAR